MSSQTHEVSNQFDELADFNLFASDRSLSRLVQKAGAAWAVPMLETYGCAIASAASYRLAEQANRHVPELRSFDARGRRIDQVEFHPSWHALLAMYRESGLLTLASADARPGRWVAAAAGFYLHYQVEAGTMCPASMTQACVPVLREEAALWAELGAPLLARDYDPRDIPIAQKKSIWIGMGMTEKQGGSDVRSNATVATAQGAGGRGGVYLLRGHKWFFSAPMCDAHLVVARADSGHSCFFVPRWRPDGTRNAVGIQRLKSKVGNRSNASSEVEFDGAWSVMMGEEGHGIRTILTMATLTRLSCVIAAAAILRQCLVQALAYARRRQTFGRRLIEHAIMRSVLADLALESEAGVALAARLAAAYEATDGAGESGVDSAVDSAWKRILTPAAKFYLCKRSVELSAEAMEVFGGNGYIEESVLARLFREAPVNSIWEGSGNVMCLDVLRAIQREPQAAQCLLEDFHRLAGGDARIRIAIDRLRGLLQIPPSELEAQGRVLAQSLVILAQACLLRDAAAVAADPFVATRFEAGWGVVAGAIDTRRIDVEALLDHVFCGEIPATE
jgi:putative acyl-CoA dehydrogenase